MEDDVERIGPAGLRPILWGGRYIIVASVLAMLLLALLYTARSARVYEATAILQVSIPNQSASSDTTATNQGLAQNYATLLASPGFLSSIRSKVEGGRLSTSDLESRISADALTQTALVELHSTGSSPAAADTLGAQVASAFLADLQSEATERTTKQQEQVQQTVTSLSERISALQASANASSPQTSAQISALQASRQALVSQSASLVANGLAQGTSATISAPPSASSSPISPRRSLNLLAGLLLGLLLGVGLAWLRELLRPGLRSAEEAAALLDLPVLASIPLRPQMASDDPVLMEAYDILHANLFFAVRDRHFRIITFVGPNPQVGKTSAVEGLAKVAMRGARNVVIVDGDMRAGTLTSRMGKGRHVGMTEVLQETADLDDALLSLGPGLSLLPAHPSSVNPPSLLSSARMRTLGAELGERFDTVLIDSPPISELADGLILASLSDAVVLVARTGLTKPSDLQAAATSLRQSHTDVVGLVVFEERTVESYYPTATPGKPVAKRTALSR